MVMIMRNEDDNDDKDLRMGTGVEVSRSASENCPTATPTRHNTRPCNMIMLTTMIFADHDENADRNNCNSYWTQHRHCNMIMLITNDLIS